MGWEWRRGGVNGSVDWPMVTRRRAWPKISVADVDWGLPGQSMGLLTGPLTGQLADKLTATKRGRCSQRIIRKRRAGPMKISAAGVECWVPGRSTNLLTGPMAGQLTGYSLAKMGQKERFSLRQVRLTGSMAVLAVGELAAEAVMVRVVF